MEEKAAEKGWKTETQRERMRERDLSLIGFDWKQTTNHHGEAGLIAELAEIYNDVAISVMAKNIYILYATWLECLTGPIPFLRRYALTEPSAQ